MKTLHLIIRTPFKMYFDDYVDFIKIKSSDFVLGILPNHAPLISSVDISKLVLHKDGIAINYAIGGGVLHIKKDKSVLLLLNSIERFDEIDLERAQKSKERSLARINSNDPNIDISRAQVSLARALNRINVFIENN